MLQQNEITMFLIEILLLNFVNFVNTVFWFVSWFHYGWSTLAVWPSLLKEFDGNGRKMPETE